MKLRGDITINGKLHPKGSEVSWYTIYPFFLLHMAMFGGVLGGLLAWVLFNGYTASTIAGGVGQLTFEFKVSAPVLWTGLKWALAIGFIGGLFPAVRAARLPVTDALRAA